MKQIKLLVKNIYCSDCSDSIKSELKKYGIKNVKIQLDSSDVQKMLLECNQHIRKKEIIELLQKRGVELTSIR